MLFFSKVGNILRQCAAKHVNLEFSLSNPSLFQTIRFMSSPRIFIGGLSFTIEDSSLKEIFSQYGEIVEAKIKFDQNTARSRGFGFVTFTDIEAATSAIQAVNGKQIHGRTVRVEYATDRACSFGGGRSGYDGGGNYSGGGNGGGNSGGGNYGGGGYGGLDLGYNEGGGYGGLGNEGGGDGVSSAVNFEGDGGDFEVGSGGNFAGCGGDATDDSLSR